MSEPKMTKWKSFKSAFRNAFCLKRKGSNAPSTKENIANPADNLVDEIDEEYPEQYIYKGMNPKEPPGYISCANIWKFDVAWKLSVLNLKGDVEDLNTNYVVVVPYRPINGPYNNDTARVNDNIIIAELVADSPLFIAVQSMRLEGHNVITGRLNIPGSPWVIMFDLISNANEISARFKNEIGQDSYLQSEERGPVISSLFFNSGIFEYLVDRFFFHFRKEIALRSVLAGSIQDSMVILKDVLSRCSSMFSLKSGPSRE